jgi:hypothetical protein
LYYSNAYPGCHGETCTDVKLIKYYRNPKWECRRVKEKTIEMKLKDSNINQFEEEAEQEN